MQVVKHGILLSKENKCNKQRTMLTFTLSLIFCTLSGVESFFTAPLSQTTHLHHRHEIKARGGNILKVTSAPVDKGTTSSSFNENNKNIVRNKERKYEPSRERSIRLQHGFSNHLTNLCRGRPKYQTTTTTTTTSNANRHHRSENNRAAASPASLARLADRELRLMERIWYGDDAYEQEDDDNYDEQYENDCKDANPREHLIWGGPPLKPDVYSYSVVANAYARSSTGRKGAQAAQSVLRRLERLYSKHRPAITSHHHHHQDNNKARPNAVLYTSVIHALAGCGDGQAAEETLGRMEQLYQQEIQRCKEATAADDNDGDDEIDCIEMAKDLCPDVIAYTAVIAAWAGSSTTTKNTADGDNSQATTVSAVQKVDSILSRMEELYSTGTNTRARPNAFTYTSAMRAYTRHIRGEEGALRSEALLRKMFETDGVYPNVHSYVAVMNAWAKSGGGLNAAKRAEQLMIELCNLYEQNKSESLKPNTAAYTCVLDAYARSGGGRAAAESAERWLDEMQRDGGVFPNVQSYTAVINAIARSGEPDAAARAEDLLRKAKQPDSLAYSCVIHSWAKTNTSYAASRAEALLMELDDLSKRRKHRIRPPDEVTHAAVIHAYEKCQDKKLAAERSDALLRRIIEMQSDKRMSVRGKKKLDVWIFNDVITLWSKSGERDAADRVEEILDIMESFDESGNELSRFLPNTATYAFVVDTWVNSGRPEAGQRALEILRKMEERGLEPSARVLSAVIEALSKSGRQSSEAESLLRKMIKMNKDGDTSATPDVRTFAKLINTMCGEKDAIDRAMSLIDYMKELSDSGVNTAVRPNNVAYNSVLNCLAKSKEKRSAHLAENVLKQMEEQTAAGDIAAKPDHITYSCLISSWTNSHEEGALERAQELLQKMEELYVAGDKNMKTNTIFYNQILHALAESGEPDAAERAQNVLADMEKQCEDGDNAVEPDLLSYTTVCSAWSKCRQRGAANKAEKLLRHVEKLAKTKGDAFLPDQTLYLTVITALSRSRDRGSQQRAEDMLNEMEDLYKNGRADLKPSIHLYNTVINGWASSGEQAQAEKALALFHRLEDLYKAGDEEMRPNIFTYNWVICAAAQCRGDERERSHAFSIALERFKDIHNRDAIFPNSFTYSFFIKACGCCLPRGEERESLISGAFELCCRRGQVSKEVLYQVEKAYPTHLRQLLNIEQDTDAKTTVGDIPEEWCKNVYQSRQQLN